MADESAAAPLPQVVKTIVGEIAAMEYAGQVLAIAAVVIDKDGDVRTMLAYSEGLKMPIIAGCAILQRQVIDQATVIQKKLDL